MKKDTVFKTLEGKNDVLKHYDLFLQKWALAYEKLYVNTRYGRTFIGSVIDLNGIIFIIRV
ncbi:MULTISPECIES: hypothetical protein [unclassified Clostridium]|uniref:hypothetical protein n=1 Tax=unclassified Clostridium TaxID=2614128 RepID=UPI000297BD47|nr:MULTISPECIES: hypothetical protein [unclassified Clostridium]EKQ57980.1 MAG: hypothetical protein A370_00409 [Clostridium sp. Maddingley MBC34-26]